LKRELGGVGSAAVECDLRCGVVVDSEQLVSEGRGPCGAAVVESQLDEEKEENAQDGSEGPRIDFKAFGDQSAKLADDVRPTSRIAVLFVETLSG
jgi:hypothetical protein